MTLTQTDGHPTSINFPLSPTEVDHPVRSIAEYILASEKMMWKKAYEYDTDLDFSVSSCTSDLSNGSSGFPAPSPHNYFQEKIISSLFKFLSCEQSSRTVIQKTKTTAVREVLKHNFSEKYRKIVHPIKAKSFKGSVKNYLHEVNWVGTEELWTIQHGQQNKPQIEQW